MKILHISESISSHAGGLQFTATSLARTFSQMGNDVTFIAGKDDGSLEYTGVDTIFLEKIGFSKIKFLKKLSKEVIKLKPDLIIQHGIWSFFNMQVSTLTKKLNIPYVIVTHGMLDTYILSQNKFQKHLVMTLFQKQNLKNAKFIRALNINEKEHILNVVNNDIVVAPNGIDLVDTFNVERFNNHICFLGRIDHKKSIIELCEAWIQLEKENLLPSDSLLKVGGWAGNQAYLKSFEDTIATSSTIEYLGPVFGNDKRELFATSGGFILPSKGEGLPTAVLEAWRDNCLVIMSKECNFPVKVYGQSCIEVSPNVNSIMSALIKYFKLDNIEREFYKKNAEKELNNYSWKKIATKILGAVNHVN